MQKISGKNKVTSNIIQSYELDLKRIALELHEGVAQNLYSINTIMKLIEHDLIDEKLKKVTNDMNLTIDRVIKDIQYLSIELYPLTISTLGLQSALKSYTNIFTSLYGIEVMIENKGKELELTEQVKIIVFRVCQEALLNIAKYADSDIASISFNWQKSFLTVIIKDYGVGFSEDDLLNKETPGLISMEEKIKLLGGDFLINSNDMKGTEVILTIPYT